MLPKIKPVRNKALKEYIKQRDSKCIFCTKPSKDPHHIIRQSHKILDLAWNMFGVCQGCHTKIGNRQINHLKEVETVNQRLEQLGMTERFRTDGHRIRLDIGPEEYKYL
ncbi:MAG: hypothetical protein US20_C0005G0022 [Candidatus Pacebacteria bacterium GW2011_GWF1_36_5]|nr:MAG: hypothetical protein US20_C0005G0022 [Candidatus Pacebacteria bacterium GW2011_GWF1_36_5]